MHEPLEDKVKILAQWIKESNNIVFFGGAGTSEESGIKPFRGPDGLFAEKVRTNEHISTESGIPDFRSTDGLYSQQYDYPPETILSHTFFVQHTGEFYRFYRNKMLHPDAKPNAAHRKLAEWEAAGKLKAIITQNVDGLHRQAGSRNVLELHGSADRNYCQKCGAFYGLDAITGSEGVPRCDCGGIIKPDVVLYEEGLDEDVLDRAVTAIAHADVLIIGGTSLTVYPAAGLVRYYRGNKLVVINKTELSGAGADLMICRPIGQVMAQL